MKTCLQFFVIIFLAGCSTFTQISKSKEDLNLEDLIKSYTNQSQRLDAFAAPYFNIQENLKNFGDYLSPEYKQRRKILILDTAEKLSKIKPDQLTPTLLLTYRLFKSDLDYQFEDLQFPEEFFSFSQMWNRFSAYIYDSSPDITDFPFKTVQNYRDFISRSEGFVPFVDRQIQALKDGAKAGYALNCDVARNARESYQDGLITPLDKNPFYRPVQQFPENFTEEEKIKLQEDFKKMIQERILLGFLRFDQFYMKEYLKLCRKTYGLKQAPRGDKIYRHAIRGSTDLRLNPKEIHDLGLKEVSRLQKELNQAFLKLGMKGSLKSNLKKILDDPQSFFNSDKEMIAAYESYRGRVAAVIPQYFADQPKADFKIVPSENPEEAAGSYHEPTENTPTGRFVINTMDLRSTPKWGTETLYLHEAIPGHHFHLAQQFEMKDSLSEYQRKLFSSNAFTEGWALYAEQWGREVGLISTPEQLIGSLSDEMLRAVRLVVDTGIHEYGWSRKKVMQYMAENLAMDSDQIQIEADRYAVTPGQALGYKVGQLKILALRSRAKKELGPKFNIKDFHKVVLGSGTVSLPVLEINVQNWIKTSK